MRCKKCTVRGAVACIASVQGDSIRETPLCELCLADWHAWARLIYGVESQLTVK